MTNTNLKNGISGTIQLLIGSLLFSPMLLHPERIKENLVGWAVVGIGSVLIVIGLLRLIKSLQSSSNAIVASKESEMPVAGASSTPVGSDVLAAIGWLLIKISYGVVALTIIGTLYMMLFLGAGGASGVPIPLGLMLAGIIYVIGKSCK